MRALLFALTMLLFAPMAFGFTKDGNVYTTDGSRNDVANAYSDASHGDTVCIGWDCVTPPATAQVYNWASTVYVDQNKGVHFRGAGGGAIIGYFAGPVLLEISTGEKTFNAFIPSYLRPVGDLITVGETLRLQKLVESNKWMQGVVTAYNILTDEITINITETNGSASADWRWNIVRLPKTTINYTTSGLNDSSYENGFRVTENTTGSIEFSGIRFTNSTNYYTAIYNYPTANGKPIFVHDCHFSPRRTAIGVEQRSNRGIFWRNSFDDDNCLYSGCGLNGAIVFKPESESETSWSTPHTMGMADTTGLNNTYVEDSFISGYQTFCDHLGGSRVVIRKTVFDNAGTGSHGADTGFFGSGRHMELYDNVMHFSAYNDAIWVQSYMYIRGGSGVFIDNWVEDISSGWYGDKGEILFNVQNIRRYAGPSPCWGANQPGAQLPSYQQVGWGVSGPNSINRWTGWAGGGLGAPGTASADTWTGGVLESWYIYGNTGYTPTVALNDYPDCVDDPLVEGEDCLGNMTTCAGAGIPNRDSITAYIREGYEYKYEYPPAPYAKYTYPHPLRTDDEPEPPATPTLYLMKF